MGARRKCGKRFYLIAAAISATPAITGAANSSWTFNGSGNWTLTGNWLGGTPVAGSDVFSRHSDAINRTITYDYAGASIQFNSFQIDQTGTGSEIFSQSTNTFNSVSSIVGGQGTA